VIDTVGTGAVYKGLAIAPVGTSGSTNLLYLANFNAGTIEVYEMPLAAADPRYGDCRVRGDGDEVEVTADGQVLGRIRVSDLLP
ncbi:MAG: hypothetical protein JO116_01675, partial [Planctomycetaceae bacterium]|nr:hypothetical protein [Planctomycetaceae bacterium]